MPKRLDLSGKTFHALKVLEFAEVRSGRSHWRCLCECGAEAVVDGSKLTNGHTRSCGCLQRKQSAEANSTHGHARVGQQTKEYQTWANMMKRCHNADCPDYAGYGGRGIKVCERWHEFESFLADMGAAPTGTHSIDRTNVDADYSPANCRWATPTEQARNKRNSVFIEAFGQTKTLAEWAESLGVDRRKIHKRLKLGWPAEKALTFA